MDIEEIKKIADSGATYTSEHVYWLISEHDRLTAELRAADRGQANLNAELDRLTGDVAIYEAALEDRADEITRLTALCANYREALEGVVGTASDTATHNGFESEYWRALDIAKAALQAEKEGK